MRIRSLLERVGGRVTKLVLIDDIFPYLGPKDHVFAQIYRSVGDEVAIDYSEVVL